MTKYEGICSIEGCERSLLRYRNVCNMHYQRLRKHGSPDLRPKPTDAERLLAFVDRTNAAACWNWRGGKGSYGRAWLNGKTPGAHRAIYELLVGPIPEGLVLDHLCENQLCVNPAHLKPTTQRENVLRGHGITARLARVTHCPQGHPYDEANTYRNPQGSRECRACGRESQRRYMERKRAALR